MEEIKRLLKKNQELMEEIIANQKAIQASLPTPSNTTATNTPVDPMEELFTYHKTHNATGQTWTIGSCSASQLSALKVRANSPNLWKDVDCKYPVNQTIMETLKNKGFKLFDHSGYMMHDKLFIFAS